MASPPVLDDPNHSARRAKTRIAVAGVLLAIAIGGLTLLSQQQPAEKTEAPATKKQESISSGEPQPNETVPTQISSNELETPTTPPPEAPATPVTPPPPPQVATPQPIRNTPPSIKATGSNSPIPSEPVTPSEKPIEKTVVSPPAVAKQGTTPPKSFDVQVGVFTDMENAKQLQAKLAEHGIPSHTETKLQVGPFNTKAEADAARGKLKNLGIGSVVVPGK